MDQEQQNIENLKSIWVVCGPTASGKTALAISLAQRLHAEIISADSRQLYRELCIGVARPEAHELAAVKHHFIASHSITENYSAGKFGSEARALAEKYFETRDHLVVCGGTGLYLKAFLEGFSRNSSLPEFRKNLQQRLDRRGLEVLAAELQHRNPELAARTDLKNPQRVMRMLDWLESGAVEHQPDRLPGAWRVIKMAPDISREVLYERINQRVDQMLEKGLWEEAAGLYPLRELNALQTVGYQEIFDCMEGKISREEAIGKIKQHSRNYAKRQLTWFRRDPEIIWLQDIVSTENWLEKLEFPDYPDL
jgi:tRNA dimethylallyltransferase